MSRKGSRGFFGDALHCCIVTMFSKGFGDHSSMRQVLLILRLAANVLAQGYCSNTDFVKRSAYMCVKTTVKWWLGRVVTLKSPPQGRKSDQVNTLQHTLHRPKLVPRTPRHHPFAI